MPPSSQQSHGAGGGQDTTKGQRAAFWEAAEQGHQPKPPASVVPAPRATFPHGFGMNLLPLDWHGRRAARVCLLQPGVSLLPSLSAWREGERSGLPSPSLGAICAFPLIFPRAQPQPLEMKGEANWF